MSEQVGVEAKKKTKHNKKRNVHFEQIFKLAHAFKAKAKISKHCRTKNV